MNAKIDQQDFFTGIQDENGNYIIRVSSGSKTKDHAGMKIRYIKDEDEIEIVIPGEVTEELKLVVRMND